MAQSRVRKILLIVGGVFISAVLVALLGVNIYIGSGGVRDRIEGALTRAMGRPVEISRIGYTPWGGLKISGLEMAGDSAERDMLVVENARVGFELLPLLEKRFIVRDISLSNPEVTLREGSTPRLHVPGTGENGTSAASTPEPPSTPEKQNGEDPVPTSPSGVDVPPDSRAVARTWQVDIGNIMLNGGRLVYINDEGDTVAELSGIDMDCEIEGMDTVGGTLSVESATIRNSLYFTEVVSAFTYDGRLLSMRDIAARLCGGDVRGELELTTVDAPFPYETSLTLEGVGVGELLDDAGLPSDRITGKLEGRAQLAGLAGEWETANGEAKLQLKDGQMQQVQLFQTLGQVLRIEELVEFELEEAYADIIVRDGVTRVDPVLLRSRNLRLVADGEISDGGELDLDARLFLHKKIRVRLPDMAKENMREAEDPDYNYLDFDIEGTLSGPRSNILERLVGGGLEKKVNDVLKNLFGD